MPDKVFILYGLSKVAGHAHHTEPLLVITAKNADHAAKKLSGKKAVRNKQLSRETNVCWDIVHGAKTHLVIAKKHVAKKRLRGKRRKAALRQELQSLKYRHTSFFVRQLPSL